MKVIVENAGMYGGLELVAVLEKDKEFHPISDIKTKGCWIDFYKIEGLWQVPAPYQRPLYREYLEHGEISFDLDIPENEILKFLANYFAGCHFEIYLPEIGCRFLVM